MLLLYHCQEKSYLLEQKTDLSKNLIEFYRLHNKIESKAGLVETILALKSARF